MPTKKLIKKENQPGDERGTLIMYTGPKGRIELRADTERDTIWANLNQIADLFDVQKSAISKHFKNIFESGELFEKATVSILETVQLEGNRSVKRSVEFYNLDAIIAVGYRINSKKATQFRIWATTTLREYLVKGFVASTDRIKSLPDKILKDLDEKIGFIQRTLQKRELDKGEIDGLLAVIHDYANSWKLLKEFDEGDLVLRRGKTKETYSLQYDAVRAAVDQLQSELAATNITTELFGRERDGSFQGILKTIYQTFDGKELYESLEVKAAHLLYFIIKDHPFSDGNKRVGSFLFVLFLNSNGILYRRGKNGMIGERKINDNTLVALALLIAESDPKEKDMMVALVTNLLV